MADLVDATGVAADDFLILTLIVVRGIAEYATLFQMAVRTRGHALRSVLKYAA